MNAETAPSRYTVGIDLGTTHCVLSYLDAAAAQAGEAVSDILPIPQLTAPGSVEDKSQLPSFIYLAHEAELAVDELVLPWDSQPPIIVGTLARDLGSKSPLRLVSSAKSWLCHGDVDRHQPLLPLNSPEDVARISPVEATFRYLDHMRRAWDHRFPDNPLVDQDVTITVPASFDPGARELTAEAAARVGFCHLTLLEEPQSAVYHWIGASGEDWRKQVSVGDIILVVDMGGGTTDLSLVAVDESEGELSLNRIAVGDHILLGGDNMDLALAYRLKAKLEGEGKALQPWQIQAVVHGCRHAKEILLSDEGAGSVPITVPSRGSKLLGATLRTELTAEEVREVLIDGFFPRVSIDDRPRQGPRGALKQIGLPYAQDAAVTRHLAYFLNRHQGAAERLTGGGETDGFIKPAKVLFNGGVLKASAIATRLMEVVNSWLLESNAEPAVLLEGMDLDLAVARGAAYYGYVRRGEGVRIRGGIASSYYVGIESAQPAVPGMEAPLQALCVAPFGMEEGSDAEVQNHEFGLVVGAPVRFRFFGSTTRRDDLPGTLLDYWEPGELEEFPEIQVDLPVTDRTPGDVVPVRLASRVTELGTLCLEAISTRGGERWRVELDVRAG
ncbi:MAG: Hsp70 family protein [Gammaproteobacteria bacterium]|nr:Hsp70 family protein [Gammaproteobacteria bacterium]